MQQRVAILGASNKPERYAHRALLALRHHGHDVALVGPRAGVIEELPVVATVGELPGRVDTLTMYIGPAISSQLIEQIVTLAPGRVIFNPGSENAELAARLTTAGIPHENACTLVLLSLDRF